MDKSVLIAIPARGGSKRLPQKNILSLKGKPMISYTIEASKEVGITDHVWVCTEDDEIADVAEKYGARVFHISLEMAADDVSSTVPCLALAKHLSNEGKLFDYIFNLQPTSPLRNRDDVVLSLEKLIDTKADFLVSVTQIDPHYFHWALIKNNGSWQLYFGPKYMKERIFLDPVYRPNGAIKLGRLDKVKEIGNFFGPNLTVYEMPETRSIHVATKFDFECVKSFL